MERIVTALPDFDGNIDLSTLDSNAANLGSNFRPGYFGLGRQLISIGINICFIWFLSNFQLVQIWILNLDFQFEFYQLGFECPPQ